ncbi:hypothetical protein RAS1_14170 [Phycisphaerae bacterium RAS1]|nr:hypothetical protein RAS1_14170 [Phycisphaerae bacterium RAS1]
MTTKKINAKTTRTNLMTWLNADGRRGRRIETLSWGRLARIYNSRSATPAVRRAIEREARKCGYTPSTILHLNAW